MLKVVFRERDREREAENKKREISGNKQALKAKGIWARLWEQHHDSLKYVNIFFDFLVGCWFIKRVTKELSSILMSKSS